MIGKCIELLLQYEKVTAYRVLQIECIWEGGIHNNTELTNTHKQCVLYLTAVKSCYCASNNGEQCKKSIEITVPISNIYVSAISASTHLRSAFNKF